LERVGCFFFLIEIVVMRCNALVFISWQAPLLAEGLKFVVSVKARRGWFEGELCLQCCEGSDDLESKAILLGWEQVLC
jgi:hypothetical protein